MSKTFSKKVVLHFKKDKWNRPVVYRLSKDFDIAFNILRANIFPRQEGLMVIELISSSLEEMERGIEYLRENGVIVEPIEHDIAKNDDTCTHCGFCISICPTGALHFERPSMKVVFSPDMCVGCELCVKVCPTRSMVVALNHVL